MNIVAVIITSAVNLTIPTSNRDIEEYHIYIYYVVKRQLLNKMRIA